LRSIRYALVVKLILVLSAIPWLITYAQGISWSSVSSPYAGIITQLTVDHSGDIFVGDMNAGLYSSTDGGSSWRHADNGPAGPYLTSLAADSSGTVYAGTSSPGLYRSTDKGNSWTRTSLAGGVWALAALRGGIICAGGRQTVSISTDHGNSWTSSVLTASSVRVLSLAGDDKGNIYAGLEAVTPKNAPPYGGGVYVSSDTGKTWKSLGMEFVSIQSIAVSAAGRLFILVPTGIGSTGVYTTVISDPSWVPHDIGFSITDAASTLLESSGEVVAVAPSGFYVFSDADNVWRQATTEVPSASIVTGYYNTSGVTYAGTERDGVYYYNNSSSTWVQCGIYPAPITSLGLDQAGVLYVGTEDGIYKPGPKEGEWIRASEYLKRGTVYSIGQSRYSAALYACTSEGLFSSVDNGGTWYSNQGTWTYDIAELSDSRVIAATTGGILESADGGSTWQGYQTIGLPLTSIYCLARDFSGNILAGTAYDGIFASTASGSFWTQMGITSPLIFYSVKTIEIDNEGRIFAGTDTAGAYYSDDSGLNWKKVSSINGKDVTSFVVSQTSAYYAGSSDRGISVSTDRGLSWRSANIGLTDSSVTSLLIDKKGYLYAATDNGLFMSTGIVTGYREGTRGPSSFSLSQNYPNPFNPTTAISYKLSSLTHITLKVYDVLGREVATLIDEVRPPGDYSVQFDGSRLPSGVYFYRFAAGNFVQIRKMVLIK
jgi:photosystem II stability/assembly factor-like uncharacterized protein